MEGADAPDKDKAMFLFFLYPDDREELQFLLEGDEFDYPVCIDMDNRMGELNGFTADTYLLLGSTQRTDEEMGQLGSKHRVGGRSSSPMLCSSTSVPGRHIPDSQRLHVTHADKRRCSDGMEADGRCPSV